MRNAFPHSWVSYKDLGDGHMTRIDNTEYGLTKREVVAIAAMQGMLANTAKVRNDKLGGTPENIADWAVDYADELLKALAEPKA